MNALSKNCSWLPMALLAVVLIAVLAFLYSKTQQRDKQPYFENLALLQHLKQLDAEWELDVLKSKIGINQHYDALAEELVEIHRLLEQLQTALATQQHVTERLMQNSVALQQAIEHKADLIERFKSHNSVLRNSLMFLPTAAQDLQHALNAGGNDQAFHALADGVNKVLLTTLIYGQANDRKASEIEVELEALLQRGDARLAAPAAARLQLFGEHVRTVMREVKAVNQLLDQIAAAPTAARFDDINAALNNEQLQAVAQSDRYRQYLLLFAASLISLFVYSAIRLIRSHAVINRVNAQLKGINEGLEQSVQERTQELAGSLSLLNATLDSTTDGIIAVRITGEVICCNSKYVTMWGMDSAPPENQPNTAAVAFIAERVKDKQRYLERVIEIRDTPPLEAFDVLELKDGRVFERYVKPQRIDGKIVGRVINFRDITERQRAEQELQEAHRQLLDTSRQAGMAEVASNVLHNVGNVLNSVNVSANLVADNIKRSKVVSLSKVTELLREHAHDLAAYLTDDPKGRHLPGYLAQLFEHLLREQRDAVQELESLRSNIDHIKEIVAMQQSYSKVSGVKELVNVVDLIENALRMNHGALQRHGVTVVREFDAVPMINTEKHKILQILVNLVRNAKYACSESERADKRVTLRVTHGDEQIKIAVIDNGVGISAENMTRIFGHGFTTRKDGHGFGLHSGALAARELGGALRARSDGVGLGAIFTLELPLQQTESAYA